MSLAFSSSLVGFIKASIGLGSDNSWSLSTAIRGNLAFWSNLPQRCLFDPEIASWRAASWINCSSVWEHSLYLPLLLSIFLGSFSSLLMQRTNNPCAKGHESSWCVTAACAILAFTLSISWAMEADFYYIACLGGMKNMTNIYKYHNCSICFIHVQKASKRIPTPSNDFKSIQKLCKNKEI